MMLTANKSGGIPVNKNLVNDKFSISIVVLFIMGSTLVLATASEAGKDSWIAILVSIITSIPIVLMYSRIIYLFKKDFYDISNILFGKFIGGFVNILYIWYSLHLGVLVLRNFGEFVRVNTLVETPMVVVILSISILCIWGSKQGINLLGRLSQVTLIILVFFILITIILMIPLYNIDNIKPLFQSDFTSFSRAVFSTITFPFCEIIIFYLFMTDFKNDKSYFKVYINGLIIGGIIVFLTAFSELLVLGIREYTSLFFPSYKATSRINIGGFLQRLEIVTGIALMCGGFIKVSVCIVAASNGVTKIIKCNNYNFIITPITLIMVGLSIFIYDSVNEMFRWAFEIYPYYALFFKFIIPFIMLIFSEIRYKNVKSRGVKNE